MEALNDDVLVVNQAATQLVKLQETHQTRQRQL